MAVKRSCYGLWTSDSRYPDRLPPGIQFLPFANGFSLLEMTQTKPGEWCGLSTPEKLSHPEVYN